MSAVKNVLFLCPGNSSRSIMAEAILGDISVGKGLFKGFSAGSAPLAGQINPFALEQLERNHLPAAGLHSKSWEEFTQTNAPVMDFIFTVSDSAAKQPSPSWPGTPMLAHWGIPDPEVVEGNDMDKRRAYVATFNQLRNRIQLLTSLPLEKLDRSALQTQLDSIGRSA